MSHVVVTNTLQALSAANALIRAEVGVRVNAGSSRNLIKEAALKREWTNEHY